MSSFALNTPDGAMEVFNVLPDGISKGVVVVLQEAFGITDHIKDVCGRFADDGYRAVAPDLFHRSGGPVLGYDELPEAKKHMAELTQSGLLDDLQSTIDYLVDEGFALPRIAVVGFCMGGSVAFLAATAWPLGAAVTFYGGGVIEGRFGMPPLIEMVSSLRSPWLGLYGDVDATIPVLEVEQLQRSLEESPVTAELVRYPDANHGFNCDARDSYHAPSAVDAWGRALAWLDANVAPR